jgi:hypothetical protein
MKNNESYLIRINLLTFMPDFVVYILGDLGLIKKTSIHLRIAMIIHFSLCEDLKI